MGYYTTYNLTVIDGDSILIAELREENESANYAISNNGEYQYTCKWYDHEKDLKAFSAKHPQAVFKLSGEGEESGDLWVKYFKEGKVQVSKAKITYDDYNPKWLK